MAPELVGTVSEITHVTVGGQEIEVKHDLNPKGNPRAIANGKVKVGQDEMEFSFRASETDNPETVNVSGRINRTRAKGQGVKAQASW